MRLRCYWKAVATSENQRNGSSTLIYGHAN